MRQQGQLATTLRPADRKCSWVYGTRVRPRAHVRFEQYVYSVGRAGGSSVRASVDGGVGIRQGRRDDEVAGVAVRRPPRQRHLLRERWVPSIEAATGGVVEVGVRGLPTTRFNWLLIQHFISDTDATRVYAGGSDHPIYTLRDLSVCVDPRSTGATGIPVRLVVLTTTAVKTGVAGPWGQADAQKKNYDVEFELNRLILATKPARRCRFTTQRVAKFG